jgi:hypothetical protein
MWSKVGRNVEGLHVVGDIFIKISVICVLNYVLHLFLWVFHVCTACVFLLLFCMNSCILRVFVCFNVVSKFEFLVGIAQLVVGDATLWYQSSSFQH